MGLIKDFKESIFLLMIEQRGGELAIIREINESQKMGKVTSVNACRMRKKVREVCSRREYLINEFSWIFNKPSKKMNVNYERNNKI